MLADSKLSIEDKILKGLPLREEEIIKPFAFVFNNIASRITDTKTTGNVMLFILTLKRDEDVLNCISHIYNGNKQFIIHPDNTSTWVACAERCYKFIGITLSQSTTCRL